jgi:hypothetical protein
MAGLTEGLDPYGAEPARMEIWRRRHFTQVELGDDLIGGTEADPDNDGAANIAEYAFARHPRQGGSYPTTFIDAVGDGVPEYDALLTFTRDKLALDIEYLIDVSGNLSTWHSGPPYVLWQDVTDDGNGETETVTVLMRSPLPGRLFGFARLRVRRQ